MPELLKARRPALRAKLPKLDPKNQKLLDLSVWNLLDKYDFCMGQLSPPHEDSDLEAVAGIGIPSANKLGTEMLQVTANSYMLEWARRTEGSSAKFAEWLKEIQSGLKR